MKSTAAAILTVAVAGTLTLGAAGAASADPTGQYTYVCVRTDGTTYTLAAGDALNTCKGSYIQKYINGAQVQVIGLTGQGIPATPDALDPALDCAVALTGFGLTVISSRGTALFVSGALSTYGLKDCLA